MKPWARSSKSAPAWRTSRLATGSSCRSPSLAASASSAATASIPAASGRTPTARPPNSFGATRRPGCSAIRTSWAATQAVRPNICACLTPTLVRSRSRTASRTSRFCSCRTFSRPGTWPRISATSRAARRSRSGAAVLSASLRSKAQSFSAPAGSSPSTPSRSAWRWRKSRARRRSISRRRTSTSASRS